MGSGDSVERAILVGLVRGQTTRAEVADHLDELERLMETAGGVVVERAVQERDAPDPATLIGRGFAERLAGRCEALGVTAVVFDDDLSPSQLRNVEKVLPEDVKVLDRAAVILDIFARHARTREAQTQVELAQLNYLLPRLAGRWLHLSRQTGGIGTRGVGEKQIEIDRRLVSRRIARLRHQLARIERTRRIRRQRRGAVPTVALVGYTNAGKSSLLRRLTRAEVVVEDRLFATLDPRARRLELGDGFLVVMTDTVGFIRKLPHELVAPFRSTLDEASRADLVLHVVDGSHPSWEAQLEVGNTVLGELGVPEDRVLVVVNKIDLLAPVRRTALVRRTNGVSVSALTGEGLETLRDAMLGRLLGGEGLEVVRIPLAETDAVRRAMDSGAMVARRFAEDSVTVALRVDRNRLGTLGLTEFRVGRWNVERSQGREDHDADLRVPV